MKSANKTLGGWSLMIFIFDLQFQYDVNFVYCLHFKNSCHVHCISITAPLKNGIFEIVTQKYSVRFSSQNTCYLYIS